MRTFVCMLYVCQLVISPSPPPRSGFIGPLALLPDSYLGECSLPLHIVKLNFTGLFAFPFISFLLVNPYMNACFVIYSGTLNLVIDSIGESELIVTHANLWFRNENCLSWIQAIVYCTANSQSCEVMWSRLATRVHVCPLLGNSIGNEPLC